MVGLFGGTFDPVHLGHLHVANALLTQADLDEVRLLPCYQPVHRGQPTASTEDRLCMLELAIAEHPLLSIDHHEINRQGPSYMIDTLKNLDAEEPNSHICLIMGADAMAKLDSWKDWQSLLDYCHFIVVNRPGYSGASDKVLSFIDQKLCPDFEKLRTTQHGLVHLIEIPPSPISATDFRAAIKNGKNLDGFLPNAVLRYINEKKLYFD